ncbi:MAG: CHC2 zinc finger domain-containing protein, partial [Verrucomicrobiales bacterium]
MKTWIDFKELRSKLDTETVLTHYSVEIKRKGDQHMGFCPLPGHGGSRKSPSFSANLSKGIFHCFGCGAKGNLLDFAALMEKIDPTDGAGLRKVALELQEKFCPETGRAPVKKSTPVEKAEPQQSELPIVTNAELDFELQGLDVNHPYLLGRGFTAETIARFGLGFCSRGSLKDRVAIPLHDTYGCLIG